MKSSAGDDPLIGTVIDRRYRIDHRVGRGGQGVVYAAWHLELRARIAVKLVARGGDAQGPPSSARLARLPQEARVLVGLRHPGIVGALDLGAVEIGGASVPYLVMEWCDGQPLSAVLEQRGRAPLPLAEAVDIVAALAEAVGHAHAMGVAHRDLKPSNVMMVGGRPMVIDFGIAKLMELGEAAGGGRTQTGSQGPLHTPAYAAPEQVASARTGPWTDVHALALVFVELVTGRRPYGDRASPALGAIDPQRPTPARFGVDVGAIEGVLARALALRPDERYPEARAFGVALRRAFAASGVALAGAPPPRAAPGDERARTNDTSSTAAASGARAPPASRWPMRIAAAIGVALAASLAWAASAGLRSPLRPPAAAGAKGAASMCSISAEVVRARAGALGWALYNSTTGEAYRDYLLSRGSASAMKTAYFHVEEAPSAPAVQLADGVRKYRGKEGVAYGIEGTCAILLTGPKDASTVRLFEALTSGARLSLEGNTVRGPDHIDEAAKPRSAPKIARRLSELGADELEARVGVLGWPLSRKQRAQSTLSVSLRNGTNTITVTWVSLSDARAAAGFGAALPPGTAYAVDGLVAVWVFEVPADRAARTLARVLSGLGAEIRVAR